MKEGMELRVQGVQLNLIVCRQFYSAVDWLDISIATDIKLKHYLRCIELPRCGLKYLLYFFLKWPPYSQTSALHIAQEGYKKYFLKFLLLGSTRTFGHERKW